MQDVIEATHSDRVNPVHEDRREERHDNAKSSSGDLASDAVGVPLLSDDPAPLSQMLHIPTLLSDTARSEGKSETATKPLEKVLEFLGIKPTPENKEAHSLTSRVTGETPKFDLFGRSPAIDNSAPQNSERATTPADAPRDDAGTFVGVPSNHPKTPVAGTLEKLDKVALSLGALMTIGPLFAAMVSRSMG